MNIKQRAVTVSHIIIIDLSLSINTVHITSRAKQNKCLPPLETCNYMCYLYLEKVFQMAEGLY